MNRVVGTDERPQDAGPAKDERPRQAGVSGQALLSTIPKILYALLGVLAIVALSYLFGHGQLEGALYGNDISVGLSSVEWYNRWFPRIPLWYPLQGGGTTYPILYPTLPSLLSVVIHRLSGFTTVQAFRLLGFMSIPLTAVGIYFLVWLKLRNQTAALIAGIFFLLSSGSWDWLVRIGLYAQSVSLMFFPWTFICFDAFLTRSLQPSKTAKRVRPRILFLLSALMYAILFLMHPRTGVSFAMAVGLYALIQPFLHFRFSIAIRKIPVHFMRAVIAVVIGIALTSFWFIPLSHANSIANREGLSYNTWDSLSYYDFPATLGITPPLSEAYLMTFAIPVVILAVVGMIVGLIKRKAAFAWGAVSVGAVLFVAMPGIWPGLVRVFEFLWARVMDRPVLIALVLMPAVAAYGALAPGEMLVDLGGFLLARITRGEVFPRIIRTFGEILRTGATAILALTIAFAMVIGFIGLESRIGYGPPGSDGGLPLRFDGGRLTIENEPELTLSRTGDLYMQEEILGITQSLELDEFTRLDVSPNLGGITQRLNLYSEASMVNIYNYQASIIHGMWGYQQGLFYGETEATYHQINELAKWFGIQYVLLNRTHDSIEKYDPSLWPVVHPLDNEDGSLLEVRQYLDAPEMASLLRAPSILVIGGYENAIYDQVFRTFVAGGIGYKEATLVEGTHNIDDYSLAELNRFNVVLLHGYGHRKHNRAWRLLEQFVQGGGSLYVDTGWQYWTPDWELGTAPEVLPIENLEWTDLGVTENYAIEAPEFGEPGEVDGFAPLSWEGSPWSVSCPSVAVRAWGETLLSVESRPIIVAGRYGEGKVVWSGMNLIGHANTYDNDAERAFLKKLIEWLAPPPTRPELGSPRVARDYPDRLLFEIQGPIEHGTTLLWREAYAPYWSAVVRTSGGESDVPIYRAGPGMMLLMPPEIDEESAIIEMDIGLGWIGIAGIGLSIFSVLGLLGWVLEPRLQILDRIKSRWVGQRSGSVEGPRKPMGTEVAPSSVHEELEIEIGETADLKALMAKLEIPDQALESHDEEADQLINWWRNTKSSDGDMKDDSN
jgi:hypothetical protein